MSFFITTNEKFLVPKQDRIDFINDIIAVCQKHNLSLSHEDTQGSFVIQPYSVNINEWLKECINHDVLEENNSLTELIEESQKLGFYENQP